MAVTSFIPLFLILEMVWGDGPNLNLGFCSWLLFFLFSVFALIIGNT